KLKFHDENVLEELELEAYNSEHLTEILGMENSSIRVGKVKTLNLVGHAVRILPKLRMHEENAIEELVLSPYYPENITEILKEENNSIWVGKMKRLELIRHAVRILPKLKFHDENVLEELELEAYNSEHLTEILGMEN
ncbi:MAG: uncharacterized protein A8A55_3605, partial [Amphiamblys sp. WSBS2006]